MLKKILVGLLIIVLLFLGSGFLLSSNWKVEQSVFIDAPTSAIYPSVATLKTWPDWTYWNRERTPDCEWSFQGPDMGVGAVMSWDGKVHMKGSLTIDTADPEKGIEYTLDMEGMDPMKGAIVFAAEGSGTKVTWRGEGETDGMPWSRWMVKLLTEPAASVEFEEGLQNLKPLAEASAAKGNKGKAVEASADKDKK